MSATSTDRTAAFLRAAERTYVEAKWGACVYISGGETHHDHLPVEAWQAHPEVLAFSLLFRPDGFGDLGLWWESGDEDADNAARVIALCFMAAMVEAGDA